MTTIGTWLEHPSAQALAWALMHFVWQGAAIGIVTWIILRAGRLSATSRYAVSVAALAAMLAAPLVTFAVVPGGVARDAGDTAIVDVSVTGGTMAAASTPAPARQSGQATATNTHTWRQIVAPVEPFVLAAWLAGVIILSCRLLGGWLVARRYATRGLRSVSHEVDQMARRVADELGLRRLVRLFESSAVAVPVTIGWMKPVVLLPMSAVSGLSPSQIEALVAHELAHIRRHDYLVNLLQSAIETLLFYHPAVWWVSKQVRAEREHCCDDLVVAVCDRVVYVRALTDLAAMTSPRLALAATDGSLVRRVKRLLGPPGSDRDPRPGWLAAMLGILIVGAAIPVAVVALDGRDPQQVPPPKHTAGLESVRATDVPKNLDDAAEAVPAMSEESLQEPASQARALSQLMQQEQEAVRQMQEAQVALEHRRLALQLSRLAENAEGQRDMLAATLAELQARADRAKKLHAAGVLGDEALAQLQVEMRTVEQKMRALEQAHRHDVSELELKRAELEQLRHFELRKAEIELARRAAGNHAQNQMHDLMRAYVEAQSTYKKMLDAAQGGGRTAEIEAARDRLVRLEQEMVELRRVLAESQARLETTAADQERTNARALYELLAARDQRTPLQQERINRQWEMVESMAPVGENDVVATGDIIMIRLHNEPDLPVVYLVQENGTIRLPLIGPIKVLGRTARQIPEDIRKQFTDRKLATESSIEVTVRRPRRQ